MSNNPILISQKKVAGFEQIIRFFQLDVRSLALFRVCLAIILICDLLLRFRYISDHYSDQGVLPTDAMVTEWTQFGLWSIHILNGHSIFQIILFIIATLVAICLGVGYKTRLATLFSWILLLSLHNRNWMLLNSGDIELRMLLFWAMFLPLGAAYSVDSALNTSRKSSNRNQQIFSTATVALILQICFIYWFAAILKDDPVWWIEGSATYYALSLDYMTTPFGTFLLNFPGLLKVATWFTIWFELVGPFFLFIPFKTAFFRLWTVILFCLLHLGFGLGLNLSLFPFISATAWLALLPGDFWDNSRRWLATKSSIGLTIYYEKSCDFSLKMAYLSRTFLILPEATLTPLDSNSLYSQDRSAKLWGVHSGNGKVYSGFDGIIYLATFSPLLNIVAPFLKWQPIYRAGNCLCCWISRHHPRLSMLTRPLTFKAKTMTSRLSSLENALVLIALTLIICWNINSLSPKNFTVPSEIKTFSRAFGLIQSWNMFAPTPSLSDGWYVIPGTLENGQKVDVYNGGQSITWERPKNLAKTYTRARWRKYLERIRSKSGNDHLPYYGRYLCQSWNGQHDHSNKLKEFDIYFMLEMTLPDYQTPDIEKVHISHHQCNS
ncbi:MAG: HTTM domain-containing protein [Crocosphaera sp.]